MSLRMIVQRMWRDRRRLGVLWVAVCLVTGFFALGPLYARATSDIAARYVLRQAGEDQLTAIFVNTVPYATAEDDWPQLIAPHLGAFAPDHMRVTFSLGPQRTQQMTCGYHWQPGEPIDGGTSRAASTSDHCYKFYGYSDPRAVFTLVEGRWPQRLEPPGPGDVGAPTVMDVAQTEAILSAKAAAAAGVEVGDKLAVGSDPGRAATVEIVGLVEPIDPDDVFWDVQSIVKDGVWTTVGDDQRYDIAPVFVEDAYHDWLTPVGELNTYFWWMRVSAEGVGARELDALDTGLRAAASEMQRRYPEIELVTQLLDVIQDFREGVAEVEGPIVLLSAAVLALMLYNLVTIATLDLDRQRREWAVMSGRGASAGQLTAMHLATMGILGAVAALLGPLVAAAFLWVIAQAGPLAAILDDTTLRLAPTPSVFALSFAAAGASVLALTLPAWMAARRSLALLKHEASRPPTRPAWARYFLDVALLLVGVGFMLRLYFLIGGDAGESLPALLRDPAELVRLAAEHGGGLDDPFNVAGPVLLLAGAAMLWLRLFPLLMRLAGRAARGLRGLAVPLAMWGVARDPGHYAQLVLLLIGTLALGTASLAVRTTHDAGAWEVAAHETGAHVRVTFDPAAGAPLPDWQTLPGVGRAARLVRVEEEHQGGARFVTLAGVDPAALAVAFPGLAETVEPLRDVEAPQPQGVALPEDVRALSLQLYAEPDDGAPTEVALDAVLLDALGVPVYAPMEADSPGPNGFTRCTAAIDAAGGQAPYRLLGLRIDARRGGAGEFDHTIYIDDLAAAGSGGEVTVLADFEAETVPEMMANQAGVLNLMTTTAHAAGGEVSLRVYYRVTRQDLRPVILTNRLGKPRLMVVISQAFAEYVGGLTGDPPLQVGDSNSVTLHLPFGYFDLPYQVVGVVRDFPTLDARDYFMLTTAETLRPVLNLNRTPQDFYDWNQAWLSLDGPEPPAALASALDGFDAAYAWDRYRELQREPLPNAIAGMLFAGFWVSLGLSVMDFAYYLAVTAQHRANMFAVLRAMGWDARYVWGMLTVEQVALVAPALLVGVTLGAALAYLLLPFLTLVGRAALRVPAGEVLALLLALSAAFALLLSMTAARLRRVQVHEALRASEE